MRKHYLIIAIVCFVITFFCTVAFAQKAVFMVQWTNGTPQLPEGVEIQGISAMENVTGNGTIKAQIEAEPAVIESLKSNLTFIKNVEEN